MPGLTPESVRIISEFAAGGAALTFMTRLAFERVRQLRPFGRRAFRAEGESVELSDAKLMGEVVLGALAAGFAAAWYLGALHFLDHQKSGLAMALFGFGTAAAATFEFHRERLPGEEALKEGAIRRGWLGLAGAGVTLAIAASQAYR